MAASSPLLFAKHEGGYIRENEMIGHVTYIGEKRNTHGFGRETAREEAIR
jgi:hypothetical protein